MGRVAVIDIGTVTCRLGVADVADGRVSLRSKTSTICNLGEGVAETGALTEGACERVTSCVRSYLEAAREAGAAWACCTLTSAARDASNAAMLLDGLRDLGVAPQVIPGEVEGSLTFLGVAQDFPAQRIVVADNGGGSTEVAVGTLGEHGVGLEAVRSINVGCRRVTDLFLAQEGPLPADGLRRAREFARDVFARELPAEAPEACATGRLVCVGGTATTLVAIAHELVPYDPARVHLQSLELAQVDALAERLASLPLEERREVPGLQPKRADVIVAGSLVVSELMRACRASELTVSESDLLVGLSLATDAAASGQPSPVAWTPELFSLR